MRILSFVTSIKSCSAECFDVAFTSKPPSMVDMTTLWNHICANNNNDTLLFCILIKYEMTFDWYIADSAQTAHSYGNSSQMGRRSNSWNRRCAGQEITCVATRTLNSQHLYDLLSTQMPSSLFSRPLNLLETGQTDNTQNIPCDDQKPNTVTAMGPVSSASVPCNAGPVNISGLPHECQARESGSKKHSYRDLLSCVILVALFVVFFVPCFDFQVLMVYDIYRKKQCRQTTICPVSIYPSSNARNNYQHSALKACPQVQLLHIRQQQPDWQTTNTPISDPLIRRKNSHETTFNPVLASFCCLPKLDKQISTFSLEYRLIQTISYNKQELTHTTMDNQLRTQLNNQTGKQHTRPFRTRSSTVKASMHLDLQ